MNSRLVGTHGMSFSASRSRSIGPLDPLADRPPIEVLPPAEPLERDARHQMIRRPDRTHRTRRAEKKEPPAHGAA